MTRLSATSSTLLVAHQLGEQFQADVAPFLPSEIVLAPLSPWSLWDVPTEAQALIARPPRGVARPEKPPGWPRDLRWVQAVSAGIDEFPEWIFDVPVVTCGRGANSAPLAEFVIASLLAVEKRFSEIWLTGPPSEAPPELGMLSGKTLGLLGLGSIGLEVAKRAHAFGLRILAHRRTDAPSPVPYVELTELESLLARSDHVAVLLPLTVRTRHLLDAHAFRALKPGAHLVNISRGGVIDHAALLAALDSGHVGFATLDVTEPEPLPAGHPLYTHPRTRISPHIAYGGRPLRELLVRQFLANLTRFLAGEPLAEQVRPEIGY
jgi:phosphoglycerate dehydrogenase-like enzyme